MAGQTRNDGLFKCLIVFYTAAPIRPRKNQITSMNRSAHRQTVVGGGLCLWWWCPYCPVGTGGVVAKLSTELEVNLFDGNGI